MEWFFFLLVVFALVIWFQAQSSNAKGSPSRPAGHKKSKTSSGKLAFQEAGRDPQVDSEGRVVVKLKGGNDGVILGINKSHLSNEVALKLSGKLNEDEEFAKSIRARVRLDKNSQFENSFVVETVDGKLIGWILKSDSTQAASVFGQVDSAIRRAAPELAVKEFTFDVSLRVEGYWNEVSEEGEPEEWEPDFDLMEIRIKSPVDAEVD